MTPLAGDNRLPRYQRLAETFRREIMTARWKPGDRLPSETDLASRFEVAPGTVRQAIGGLVDEGLLERQQGRGTFVRRPSFDKSLARFFRVRREDGAPIRPESRILRRKKAAAPENVAHALKLKPGAPAVSMVRLRLVEDEPFLAETIWLPLPRFRPFLLLDEEEIGPLLYPVYDRLCGAIVASAEETLTAEIASEEIRKLLRLPEGAPVIVVDRLAKAYDGEPLEWRRSRGAAGRFQYHAEIR